MDLLDIKSQNYSFLGKNGRIEGNLSLSGPTMISALIEGEIRITDNSTLKIEHNGKVRGSIFCTNLMIHGEVEGVIESTGSVIIYSTATVCGKINAESIQVHSGAILNIEGHMESSS